MSVDITWLSPVPGCPHRLLLRLNGPNGPDEFRETGPDPFRAIGPDPFRANGPAWNVEGGGPVLYVKSNRNYCIHMYTLYTASPL